SSQLMSRIYWRRKPSVVVSILFLGVLMLTCLYVSYKTDIQISVAMGPANFAKVQDLSNLPAPEKPGGLKSRESDEEGESPKDTFDRYHDWDGLYPITPPVKSTERDVGPGEGGAAYHVDRDQLSPSEQRKFDDGWTNNGFNQYASDRISVRRYLPDFRGEGCRTQQYQANLPSTSVIICFHNEDWGVLLRSVHSVIDNSPVELLKEIILVDDFSDRGKTSFEAVDLFVVICVKYSQMHAALDCFENTSA
ncbi:polypeptide N-acetylgalactosaminyltransferase, partial [Paragonimus westermani]